MEKVTVIRWSFSVFASALIVGSLWSIAQSSANADSLFKSSVQVPDAAFLEPQKNFLQVTKSEEGKPLTVETAVSTYRNSETGLEVALVGAMHIADEHYFNQINSELDKHEVVLYELVAPKDTKPTRQVRKNKDGYSGFQQTLGDLLDVEHQMDLVDYQKDHFVHADLSMQDLINEGKKRGETQFTFLMSIFLDLMKSMSKAEQQKQTIAGARELKTVDDLIDLVSQPSELKQFLALTFASQDAQDGIPGLSTINPYIIDMRNEAALKVLDSQIATGKKKLAIFYGAAHLPDFERRLVKNYGLKRVKTEWLVAWDLSRESKASDNPIVQWLKLMKAMQA